MKKCYLDGKLMKDGWKITCKPENIYDGAYKYYVATFKETFQVEPIYWGWNSAHFMRANSEI
jgi:hypothetical protein